MTRITDERLGALRTILGTETCLDDQNYLDLADALRELQEFRQIQRVLREVADDADHG